MPSTAPFPPLGYVLKCEAIIMAANVWFREEAVATAPIELANHEQRALKAHRMLVRRGIVFDHLRPDPIEKHPNAHKLRVELQKIEGYEHLQAVAWRGLLDLLQD